MLTYWLLHGDAREKMGELPDGSVQTCVTSPPYWGLRDYGTPGQLGLEPTPDAYAQGMVAVFREVRRVLRDDGTVWLNLGDSYAGGGNYRGITSENTLSAKQLSNRGARGTSQALGALGKTWDGMKSKDLVGIPWRVAFALQADGWYLRSDIIWAKRNCMPESVRDRPTRSHEYIFLVSKSARYFYDAAAIAERVTGAMLAEVEQGYNGEGLKDYDGAGIQNPSSVKSRIIANARKRTNGKHAATEPQAAGRRIVENVARARAEGGEHDAPFGLTRNKRSVWHIATQPYPKAHFATYPEALIEPCILAGSQPGDTVLDPFCGSGTTGAVAIRHGRHFIGIELNAAYIELERKRIGAVAPLFARELTAEQLQEPA